MKKETSSRPHAPLLQLASRTILVKDSLDLLPRGIREHDTAQTFFPMSSFENVRKLASWLGDVDDGSAPRPRRPHSRDDGSQLLGHPNVARSALGSRQLKRRLVESLLVTFCMCLKEPPEDIALHQAARFPKAVI